MTVGVRDLNRNMEGLEVVEMVVIPPHLEWVLQTVNDDEYESTEYGHWNSYFGSHSH